ncbi:MAG: LysR family transcriptional regulator [Raoultibacter sp.]
MLPRDLENFDCLYKNKNVTKAASELFVPRQALSTSIKKLEKTLHAELFIRDRNGMEPTEQAAILEEYIEQQKLAWSKTLNRLNGTFEKEQMLIGAHFLHMRPETIRLIMNYQDVSCRTQVSFITIEEYVTLNRMVKKGEIDIALTRQPLNSPDLEWILARKSNVVFLMREDNPLANRESVDFKTDLKGQTYLCASYETLKELKLHLEEASMAFEYVTPSQTLLTEKILKGDGVFAIPEQAASIFPTEGIVAVHCESFPVSADTYAIFKKDAPESIRRLVDYIVEQVYSKIIT